MNIKTGLAQITVINGKHYTRCAKCKKLVRLDKWIGGSFHLCIRADEPQGLRANLRPMTEEEIARMYATGGPFGIGGLCNMRDAENALRRAIEGAKKP